MTSGLSLELFLSLSWTKAGFIRASARLLYQRRAVPHHLWISNWIISAAWALSKNSNTSCPRSTCRKTGLTCFSSSEAFNCFLIIFLVLFTVIMCPCLQAQNPFWGGHRAGSMSFPLAQLSLAVAQNIWPGIFSLKLNVLWISLPYVFLGKYLLFLLCLLQFDIPVSAHIYLSSGLAPLEDAAKQVCGGPGEVLCFLFMLRFNSAAKSHVSLCLPVRNWPCCCLFMHMDVVYF